MIASLNAMMQVSDDNLGKLSQLLSAIAEGDLTARMAMCIHRARRRHEHRTARVGAEIQPIGIFHEIRHHSPLAFSCASNLGYTRRALPDSTLLRSAADSPSAST